MTEQLKTQAGWYPSGLRLGERQEEVLRQWPLERIRPKSVSLGVRSLIAEVDALRAQLAASEQRAAALRIVATHVQNALQDGGVRGEGVAFSLKWLLELVNGAELSPYLKSAALAAAATSAATEGGPLEGAYCAVCGEQGRRAGGTAGREVSGE